MASKLCVVDAASRPVEVLLRKGAASGSGADLTAAASPDVVWLTGLGYGASEALAALQANAGDREAALASLHAALTGEAPYACTSCRSTNLRFCLTFSCCTLSSELQMVDCRKGFSAFLRPSLMQMSSYTRRQRSCVCHHTVSCLSDIALLSCCVSGLPHHIEGAGEAPDNADWHEERTALQAIYEQDVAFPSAACTVLQVAADGAPDEVRLTTMSTSIGLSAT